MRLRSLENGHEPGEASVLDAIRERRGAEPPDVLIGDPVRVAPDLVEVGLELGRSRTVRLCCLCQSCDGCVVAGLDGGHGRP